MAIFFDQLGRIVPLQNTPSRIVSLVPSQTELLSYLGFSDEVVGITKFCIHPPEWFKTKERIGGTKNVNLEKIRALQPDLILANKEENEEEQIRELEKDCPVWVSNITCFDDALKMISAVGAMLNKEEKAVELVSDIENSFQSLAINETKQIRAAYLIWKDPYMTVGKGTFINDMISKAGFENVFKDFTRYPQIRLEQVKELNPQVLFLSTEPYPFTEHHVAELQPRLPQTKIMLANGELFSWYGSRMLQAPAYFKHLRQRLPS